MRRPSLISFMLAALVLIGGQAHPASLRVAPVMLDLRAPASSIRVWNGGGEAINVQVRVFRWRRRGGEDVYEATDAVVASPPFATLRPGAENVIRVVRISGEPIGAEESYRIVVDELPNPARARAGAVQLVVRHSIPVFFSGAGVQPAAPSFKVERQRGGYVVSVANAGMQRLKLSNLRLTGNGKVLARRDGLVGYVLGNSSARWFIAGSSVAGKSVTINADGEAGPFHVTVPLHGS